MPDDTDLRDARLTQLEIKFSYAEDLLETLSAQMARQQTLLDALQRELLAQRQQLGERGPGFGPSGDERPPHY